ISLAGGLPAESSFPMQKLLDATSSVLKGPGALQYSITEGEPELRQWIANHLGAEITQILVTNGAQQAMDLVTRTLIRPGDTVVVEAPTYLGALQIFDLAQASIVTIDQTPVGPNLKQLESAFQQQPVLFYAVPDFHNPTGCCWPENTRREVIALAKKYKVTIMEDAPYRELRYSGTTLPSLYELAPEQVCHVGSFSKIAAPGLRLGYLCTGKDLLMDISLVKQATDLHSSTLCQRFLLACLQEPYYSDHLDELRDEYRRRRDTLVKTLQYYLGDKVYFSIPDGGMFLWLTLAKGKTDRLADACLDNNIAIVPGSVFYPEETSKARDKMRLNFTHLGPTLLTEGVKRLAAVIDTL
ncbi:MAG: PLP-dependent aminotransferase family protein, partial [Candidatus Lindowbacteria bacterium]|nr:PLP-dependent aminotransferase family protein [Candidatus Lindowbacteria bacterium]